MRLVADENCDFSIVLELRAAGYDVVSITERMPGADDQTVIDFARSERRLLITEDKDFGQLVPIRHSASGGPGNQRFEHATPLRSGKTCTLRSHAIGDASLRPIRRNPRRIRSKKAR